MSKNKDEVIVIRVTKKMKKKLQDKADAQQRPLGNYIRNILSEFIN